MKSVPSRTPNRLDVILEFTSTILSDSAKTCQRFIEIDVKYERDRFELSRACLDAVKCFIPLINETVYKYDGSKLCPTVALPTIITCCGKNIKILARHATMKLYDIDQVRDLHSYHGKCMKCKSSYYHGYKESFGEQRSFDYINCNFLMFTSGIAFSKSFMKYIDSMICIGSTSFEAAAKVYNHATDTESPLNCDRLEAAWFMHRILHYVQKFPEWPRKSNTREFDVEKLCQMVYSHIKDEVNTKWIGHVCDEIGCKQRAIVIDGNEKLYRYICGAEKRRVMGNTGEVNRYELCLRNPIKGNQSSKSSRYCPEHAGDKEAMTEEQMDLRPNTRLYAKSIHECDTTEEGCKKQNNLTSYATYNRTAGMFYVFRPCGIRISHGEMLTSESCSDVFVLLIDIFGKVPDPELLRLIAYDRSCDIHPFIARLSREGNEAASYYQNLKFVVDRFHVKNHTEKKCSLDSSECIYHPDLPQYSEYKNMNSEIAEQSFNILNKFKYITRKMSYSRRLLFFKFLDDTANTSIIMKKSKIK